MNQNLPLAGPLLTSQKGVFCKEHFAIRGCDNQKMDKSKACINHQREWKAFVTRFGRQSMLGVRRMIKRNENENVPWLPNNLNAPQPHDEEADETAEYDNYFTAKTIYCIETMVAPCGVVVAWTKFPKAESPTNILNFLASVYPKQNDRPAYICIDKACLVLKTAFRNGSWNEWQETSRFVVDSYHYKNHRVSDYLCRKWCNPAPLNGSAPNLVVQDHDQEGRPYYKRAFNTQACEQLNAWLGGFERIVSRMTAVNFDWFIHVMLFLHSKKIIDKQSEASTRNQDMDEDESEDDDSNADDDDDDDEGEEE
ncbi:hypothetical protein DENSPDRAFT_861947 [Dentipellis sp. KUC8613]|nr:hypothetical protein DENSPDRAFT_861947 [Dentipellis sp. KUC8613]